MSRTFKRSKSPNKQVAKVSRHSLYKKLVAGTAAVLIGLSSTTAIASAADSAAASRPVRLIPVNPYILTQNEGDRGCYTNWRYQNDDRYLDPQKNYAASGTVTSSDGRSEYFNLTSDWLVYNQYVGYKGKMTITLTATRAGDYFLKDGVRVPSIDIVRGGPTSVTDKAYCLDDAPHPSELSATKTDVGAVLFDPLVAPDIDRDNSAGQLRITSVTTVAGRDYGYASIVTLPNGRQGIRVTHGGTFTPGTSHDIKAQYVVTDPLGKTGYNIVTVKYTF